MPVRFTRQLGPLPASSLLVGVGLETGLLGCFCSYFLFPHSANDLVSEAVGAFCFGVVPVALVLLGWTTLFAQGWFHRVHPRVAAAGVVLGILSLMTGALGFLSASAVLLFGATD